MADRSTRSVNELADLPDAIDHYLAVKRAPATEVESDAEPQSKVSDVVRLQEAEKAMFKVLHNVMNSPYRPMKPLADRGLPRDNLQILREFSEDASNYKDNPYPTASQLAHSDDIARRLRTAMQPERPRIPNLSPMKPRGDKTWEELYAMMAPSDDELEEKEEQQPKEEPGVKQESKLKEDNKTKIKKSDEGANSETDSELERPGWQYVYDSDGVGYWAPNDAWLLEEHGSGAEQDRYGVKKRKTKGGKKRSEKKRPAKKVSGATASGGATE